MHYDESKDKSEEYGWGKYSVELTRHNTPEFETSQQRWAGVTLAVAAGIGLLVVLSNLGWI
jgi:hypothetical protein